ncbi:uncharacterized protein LOC127249059 [Andrographis paniculata]|uniref:uncharacterized protein LOC127249059 n=1 Tax=Andrographis paniculata TaxID=175694 RepID=UPI0021E97C4D|nr:uncharacterized protein LOC127249059 [Andrographis paniculata]
MSREVISSIRPPVFDGNNYTYWKNRMEAYLLTLGDETWEAVELGWTPPTKVVPGETQNDPPTIILKSKNEWTPEEKIAAGGNAKAVNAIFASVDEVQFRVISNCKKAKDAWRALENAFEGTAEVKETKLQRVESMFEALKMTDDETMSEFYTRFKDVVNQAYALGLVYDEQRLVRKMLRSVNKKFKIEVSTLEDKKKTKNMNLETLNGIFMNWEMNHIEEESSKGIALTAEHLELVGSDEEMALLSKKLSRMISEKRARKYHNSGNRGHYGGKTTGEQRKYPEHKSVGYNKEKGAYDKSYKKKFNTASRPENSSDPKCFACDGVGHVKVECATFKKKGKHAFQATWSDEEGSQESEDESDNESVVAFVAKEGESSKGKESVPEEECNSNDTIEMDIYELMEAYEEVVAEQKICVKRNKDLINTVYRLEARVEKAEEVNQEMFEINEGLQKDVKQLKMKCDDLREENDRLRKGKDKLDEVLLIGKPFGDHRVIGYQESMKVNPTTFVKGGLLTDVKIPEKPAKGKNTEGPKENKKERQNQNRRRNRRVNASLQQKSNCKYCFRFGHAESHCFKLARDLMSGKKVNWPSDELKQRVNFRMEWRPKKNQSKMMCNVILSSQEATNSSRWYFDSGCSRHMTNQKHLLKNYVADTCGEVIFGDGAKGKIVGYGSLEAKGIPKLTKVYFVEGLSTNLISISQLCDDELLVKFTKDACEVFNNKKECVMTGKRSRNNCYLLDKPVDVALISKDDEALLWHTRLGHVNQQSLMKLSKQGIIRGLPKFSKLPNFVCGDCARGKQKRVSHPQSEHQSSKTCLDLLHMDLMGPVDTPSLGGKKYILVCIDDFSRYTWVDFMKEK